MAYIKKSKKKINFEAKILRPDKTEIPVSASCSPIYGRNINNIKGWIVILHDIQQLKNNIKQPKYLSNHD